LKLVRVFARSSLQDDLLFEAIEFIYYLADIAISFFDGFVFYSKSTLVYLTLLLSITLDFVTSIDSKRRLIFDFRSINLIITNLLT
jgi:hypothetical protein